MWRGTDLEDILKETLDEAVRRGLLPEDSVTYRDLWDTRLMNCPRSRPKEVIRTFLEYEKESPRRRRPIISISLTRTRLYPPLPREEGPALEGGQPLRAAGYLHQSVQAGEGSKGDCGGGARGGYFLSEVPAVQGSRGIHRKSELSGRENHRVIPVTIDGKRWCVRIRRICI